MENILVWIAIFIMFFKYIIFGIFVLLLGVIIFALKKLGFVSETIANVLFIGNYFDRLVYCPWHY